MKKAKTPNYPFYETTVFENFRVMTENVAKKYPDRYAISYKKKPHDKEVVHVTYAEARDYIRNLGTACIELGLRDKHVAIVGESSFEWIATYFALMSIGAVTVPIDKEYPAADIAGILDRAECHAVFYSSVIKNKIDEMRDNLATVKQFVCMTSNECGDMSVSALEARVERLEAANAAAPPSNGSSKKGKGVREDE